MAPISFNERLDLLQRVSRGWLELKKAFEAPSLTEMDAPVSPGGWTGRDLLVHLAVWDEELTRVLLDLNSGLTEAWPDMAGQALDAWNEERVAVFRDIPAADALDYFEQAHFELMELLEGSPSVTRALVEPAIGHYAEHLQQIRNRKRP